MEKPRFIWGKARGRGADPAFGRPAWLLSMLDCWFLHHEMHFLVLIIFILFYGRGDARRCIKKKIWKARRMVEEGKLLLDRVGSYSTAPPFGKGQVEIDPCPVLLMKWKEAGFLGGRRKEGRKIGLAARGEPDLSGKGWRQCWQETFFPPADPFDCGERGQGPGRLMQEDPAKQTGPQTSLKVPGCIFNGALWQYQ